jgi:DNA replication protein DnaC
VSCDICKGKGFLLKEIDGEAVWSMCECQRAKNKYDIITRKLIDAGIPKEFWEINFEFYNELPFPPAITETNEKNLKLIEQFLNNPEHYFKSYRLLWIWGKDDNAGHSSIAAILGKKFIEKGYTVKFFRMANLINHFITKNNKDIIDYIQDVDLLIIDDALDVSRAPLNTKLSYVTSLLFNFFSEALSNDVNMICTSNSLLAGVDDTYREVKTLFSRYIYELEIRGNIIKYTKLNPEK